MGRYIEWDDAMDRYPELSTIGGAEQFASVNIKYAESLVDGLLRSHYTTPFSGDITVVKDLAIDAVYWKAAGRKLDEAAAVWSQFFMTVDLLKTGKMEMVYDDGTLVAQNRAEPGMWSNTMSYHSAFGWDDPTNWRISDEAVIESEDRD